MVKCAKTLSEIYLKGWSCIPNSLPFNTKPKVQSTIQVPVASLWPSSALTSTNCIGAIYVSYSRLVSSLMTCSSHDPCWPALLCAHKNTPNYSINYNHRYGIRDQQIGLTGWLVWLNCGPIVYCGVIVGTNHLASAVLISTVTLLFTFLADCKQGKHVIDFWHTIIGCSHAARCP